MNTEKISGFPRKRCGQYLSYDLTLDPHLTVLQEYLDELAPSGSGLCYSLSNILTSTSTQLEPHPARLESNMGM